MLNVNYWTGQDLTVKKIKNNRKVVANYIYKDFEKKFSSYMVNDFNQYFCSTCTIDGFDNSNQTILYRVLYGKKPMSILNDLSKKELKDYIIQIDVTKFDYQYEKDDYTNHYKLFVAVKGKLKDLFDLKALAADYRSNEIKINIKKYMYKEIKYFFELWDENDVDENIELWVKNLIMGIPVENSISQYSFLVKK